MSEPGMLREEQAGAGGGLGQGEDALMPGVRARGRHGSAGSEPHAGWVNAGPGSYRLTWTAVSGCRKRPG